MLSIKWLHGASSVFGALTMSVGWHRLFGQTFNDSGEDNDNLDEKLKLEVVLETVEVAILICYLLLFPIFTSDSAFVS